MASWTRLHDLTYFCEYGLGDYKEHCEHSSDVVDGELDGVHNAAHWHDKGHNDHKTPAFLCNYHYEELVLGMTHPTDNEIAELEAAALEMPSAEEFEEGIGEVK